GQTVSLITKLKKSWSDVSGEFKPDYRATNIAQLADHRDIHAFLLSDLGKMLKAAQDKAAAEIKPEDKNKEVMGFSFLGYKTRFAAPGSAGLEGSGPDDHERDRTPRGVGKPAPTPPAGGAAEAAAGQRINVELDLRTARSDADKFVVGSVMTWLKENAD